MAEGANDPGKGTEPQVTVEVEALRRENEGLKTTQRSLQRELERARQTGGSARNLEERLQANEEALIASLDILGKLAVAAELKDVNPAPVLEKLRKPKPQAEQAPSVEQQRAGVTIVAAAEAANIADFESAWRTDERLSQARIYWAAGQYDAAAEAAKMALRGAKTKTYTEEELKRAVDEASTREKQRAASTPPGSSATTGNERTITVADLKKMSNTERREFAADIRKALRKANG